MEEWSTLQQALMITIIGVGLVFAVLFVMWGLMAVLVRVTTPRTAAEAPAPEDTAATAGDAAITAAPTAARRRAALVGVAVALAIEAERAIAPPLTPAQGAISPWQATIRGNALSRRAGAFRRNPPPQ